jgi:hypothetical protein
MAASSVQRRKDLNRIETVSLSTSNSLPRPSATARLEASSTLRLEASSSKTDRRKMYSRPPQVVMPAPAPLPGVLLL